MYNVSTSQIMAPRHQFVYGYNTKERKEFIEQVITDYPVILNQDTPIAIPIEQYGLSESKNISEDIDQVNMDILARDYFSYTTLYSILYQIQKQTQFDLPKEQKEDFFNHAISLYFNEPEKLKTLDDVVDILGNTMHEFSNAYTKYINTGELLYPEEPATFIDLEEAIQDIKKLVGTNAYFGLLIDYQTPIALSSYKAINNLIYSRCVGTSPLSVICEPGEWKTYVEETDRFIEYEHDYSQLYLDGSYKKYLKSKYTK